MPIKLPLKDGTDWEMPMQYEMVLKETYHDVEKQMKQAYVWLMSNPERRPTQKGVRRFCANWFGKHPELIRQTRPEQVLSVARAENTVVDFEAGKARLQELRKMIKRVA